MKDLNLQKLGFRGVLEEIEFIDNINSNVFHFQIKMPDTDISGFGTDSNVELARSKALCELAERAVWKSENTLGVGRPTTSGYAAHFCRECASEAAVAELIERDIVLSWWLLRRPPCWLKLTDMEPEARDLVTFIQNEFAAMEMEFILGHLASVGEYQIFCSVLLDSSGKNWGMVFTSAAKKTAFDAIKALYFDQRRAAGTVRHRLRENKLFFTEDLKPKSTADHFEYYLRPRVIRDLAWFFDGSMKIYEEKLPSFSTREVLVRGLSTSDIFVSIADGAFQHFWVGMPKFNEINRKRLRSLAIPPFHLNRQLHPLA